MLHPVHHCIHYINPNGQNLEFHTQHVSKIILEIVSRLSGLILLFARERECHNTILLSRNLLSTKTIRSASLLHTMIYQANKSQSNTPIIHDLRFYIEMANKIKWSGKYAE